MLVKYNISYEDMKVLIPSIFGFLMDKRKAKKRDSIILSLITFIILGIFTDLSFRIVITSVILMGILTYFFFSQALIFLSTNIFLWKNKKGFPKNIQLRLDEENLVYEDLNKNSNNLKTSWETIGRVEEINNFILIHIPTINKVIIINKDATTVSTHTNQTFSEMLKSKIKYLDDKNKYYTFFLTEKDFKEACFKSVVALKHFKKRRLIFSLTTSLLIFARLFQSTDFLLSATISYFILVLIMYFYLYQNLLFKRKKSVLGIKKNQQFKLNIEVNDDSIVYTRRGTERSIHWSDLVAVHETKNNIILYLSPTKLDFLIIKKEVSIKSDNFFRLLNNKLRKI